MSMDLILIAAIFLDAEIFEDMHYNFFNLLQYKMNTVKDLKLNTVLECFNLYLKVLRQNKVLVPEDLEEGFDFERINQQDAIDYFEYLVTRDTLSIYKNSPVVIAYKHMRDVLGIHTPKEQQNKNGWF